MTAPITTLALLLSTVILIGLPVSKPVVCSAAFVSNLWVPPLHTKLNSSLPSPYLPLRLNSWLCATLDGCVSLSAVLWDLDIPQQADTIAYEDNNGCMAMGNAQKSTPKTGHIDIKYFALCDWVKCNLILLECIDISINVANHLTKILLHILFHQHMDFLLGHISPRYSPLY
jgi:hypothetical protein